MRVRQGDKLSFKADAEEISIAVGRPGAFRRLLALRSQGVPLSTTGFFFFFFGVEKGVWGWLAGLLHAVVRGLLCRWKEG
jgi:hypothetical protein